MTSCTPRKTLWKSDWPSGSNHCLPILSLTSLQPGFTCIPLQVPLWSSYKDSYLLSSWSFRSSSYSVHQELWTRSLYSLWNSFLFWVSKPLFNWLCFSILVFFLCFSQCFFSFWHWSPSPGSGLCLSSIFFNTTEKSFWYPGYNKFLNVAWLSPPTSVLMYPWNRHDTLKMRPVLGLSNLNPPSSISSVMTCSSHSPHFSNRPFLILLKSPYGLMPLLPSVATKSTWYTDIHTGTTPIYIRYLR